MKKPLTLILLLLAFIPLTSFKTKTYDAGTAKGIEFFKGSWEEALQKAKSENKNLSNFDYNQKANALIQQIIRDESCHCVTEIVDESLIKISLIENPYRDVRKEVIQKLNLKDKIELDSLESLAINFKLDTVFFKQNNIKIINRDAIRALFKDANFIKKCPEGILYIGKPLFNKNYLKAVVDYGYSGYCIPSPMSLYLFENGKWNKQ